jgi:hypothetical protein
MSSWQRSSSQLRASDAERERVVDFLRESSLTGRINHDELDERIGLAYAAVMRGDLERLLVDLPRGAPSRQPAPRPRRAVPAKRREASPAMVLVGMAALAIPMIVMAGVAVALIAVIAVGAVLTPFVVVALLLAAAIRRRRPPGPPTWQRPHYG